MLWRSVLRGDASSLYVITIVMEEPLHGYNLAWKTRLQKQHTVGTLHASRNAGMSSSSSLETGARRRLPRGAVEHGYPVPVSYFVL